MLFYSCCTCSIDLCALQLGNFITGCTPHFGSHYIFMQYNRCRLLSSSNSFMSYYNVNNNCHNYALVRAQSHRQDQRANVQELGSWHARNGTGLTSGMAGNCSVQAANEGEQPQTKSFVSVCWHLNKKKTPASVEMMVFKSQLRFVERGTLEWSESRKVVSQAFLTLYLIPSRDEQGMSSLEAEGSLLWPCLPATLGQLIRRV